MKLLKTLVMVALLAGAGINSVYAQTTASKQFNVMITLTSTCSLTTPSDVAFTYTSFQAGTSNPTGGTGAFSVSCTNTFPYTLGLQAGTGAPSGTGSASIGPITDSAVNLIYNLTLATTSASGSGAAQNYNIGGSIAGGQGGTCGAATCDNTTANNRTHTLILTY